MVFDPKTCMFTCDNFAANWRNDANGARSFAMVARPADTAFYECFDKKGRQIPVYEIVEAMPSTVDGGDIFMGYWCPYEINKTRYVTLTGAADYMFTATMDGCSFGIGTPASDGTVMVSHSNSAQDDTATSHQPMIDAQKRKLRSLLGKKSKVFDPSDYRTRGLIKKKADVSAMTFGVRDGKKWKFYAHRFRKEYPGMAVRYVLYETVKLN